MAELGIIASVIQIADTGLRLSIKLYTFGEIVSTADKSVLSISKDVSLTSSVLKELGNLLENDSQSHIFSKNAVQTADTVVKECLEVFQEMETILVKKLPSLSGQDGVRGAGGGKKSKATALLERMKWGYLQPKLQLLRSNLDRLKSTLLLMLNVITYARQVAGKSEPPSVIEDQRSLIEDLARSNQEYIRRFEQMKLGIESTPRTQEEYVHSDRTESGMDWRREQTVRSGGHNKSASPERAATPNVNINNVYINANVQNMSMGRESEKGQQPREAHKEGGKGNDLFSHLKHYLNLVTNLLNEVDEIKYEIRIDSRDRVRTDICQAYQREMKQLDTSHETVEIALAQQQLAPLVAGVKRRLEQVDAPRKKVQASRLPKTVNGISEQTSQPEVGPTNVESGREDTKSMPYNDDFSSHDRFGNSDFGRMFAGLGNGLGSFVDPAAIERNKKPARPDTSIHGEGASPTSADQRMRSLLLDRAHKNRLLQAQQTQDSISNRPENQPSMLYSKPFGRTSSEEVSSANSHISGNTEIGTANEKGVGVERESPMPRSPSHLVQRNEREDIIGFNDFSSSQFRKGLQPPMISGHSGQPLAQPNAVSGSTTPSSTQSTKGKTRHTRSALPEAAKSVSGDRNRQVKAGRIPMQIQQRMSPTQQVQQDNSLPQLRQQQSQIRSNMANPDPATAGTYQPKAALMYSSAAVDNLQSQHPNDAASMDSAGYPVLSPAVPFAHGGPANMASLDELSQRMGISLYQLRTLLQGQLYVQLQAAQQALEQSAAQSRATQQPQLDGKSLAMMVPPHFTMQREPVQRRPAAQQQQLQRGPAAMMVPQYYVTQQATDNAVSTPGSQAARPPNSMQQENLRRPVLPDIGPAYQSTEPFPSTPVNSPQPTSLVNHHGTSNLFAAGIADFHGQGDSDHAPVEGNPAIHSGTEVLQVSRSVTQDEPRENSESQAKFQHANSIFVGENEKKAHQSRHPLKKAMKRHSIDKGERGGSHLEQEHRSAVTQTDHEGDIENLASPSQRKTEKGTAVDPEHPQEDIETHEELSPELSANDPVTSSKLALHESVITHAMRRPRGPGGRFLTAGQLSHAEEDERVGTPVPMPPADSDQQRDPIVGLGRTSNLMPAQMQVLTTMPPSSPSSPLHSPFLIAVAGQPERHAASTSWRNTSPKRSSIASPKRKSGVLEDNDDVPAPEESKLVSRDTPQSYTGGGNLHPPIGERRRLRTRQTDKAIGDERRQSDFEQAERERASSAHGRTPTSYEGYGSATAAYPSYPQDTMSSYRDSSGSYAPSRLPSSPYQSDSVARYATSNASGDSVYSSFRDPTLAPSSLYTSYRSGRGGSVAPSNPEPLVLEAPKKPQCWDHGCNGRQFSTYSNLLRHQRESFAGEEPLRKGRTRRTCATSDTYISRPMTTDATNAIIETPNTSDISRRPIATHDSTLELGDTARPPAAATEKRLQKHPASFQCTSCTKRFTREYNLRAHLRTHDGEPPFLCTTCGKAFAFQDDRKRHEALHNEMLKDGVPTFDNDRPNYGEDDMSIALEFDPRLDTAEGFKPTDVENSIDQDATQTEGLSPRKRTKLGCLTCRKRRIKCGEEHPTCQNCAKSGRDCESYTPRAVHNVPLDGLGQSSLNTELNSHESQSGSSGSPLRSTAAYTNECSSPFDQAANSAPAIKAQIHSTKRGMPLKPLLNACISCRRQKIKCDPAKPKCAQCEISGNECSLALEDINPRKSLNATAADLIPTTSTTSDQDNTLQSASSWQKLSTSHPDMPRIRNEYEAAGFNSNYHQTYRKQDRTAAECVPILPVPSTPEYESSFAGSQLRNPPLLTGEHHAFTGDGEDYVDLIRPVAGKSSSIVDELVALWTLLPVG